VRIEISNYVSTAVIEYEDRALLRNGAISTIIPQRYISDGALRRELANFFDLG
jgi:hypothetical protein